MKKLFALILALVMVLSMAACGSSKPAQDASGKKTIRIAWSDDTQDATRAKVLELMRQRCEEINAERDDIEVVLDYYDANKTVDKQISDVETACLTKPNVFVFSCVDSEGSKPCLDLMKNTGAKIIDIRDMGSDVPDVIFYSSDEETYAKATSAWIVDYMEANPDKLPLKVGLVYGAAAQTPQLKRCDLVKELAEQYPDKIEIVAESFADWDTQKAQAAAEDIITANPDLKAFLVQDDGMSKGVWNAIEAAGKQDQIIIASQGFYEWSIPYLKEGKFAFTITYPAGFFARDAMDTIKAVSDGETVERVQWLGMELVTAENADTAAHD